MGERGDGKGSQPKVNGEKGKRNMKGNGGKRNKRRRRKGKE